MNICIANDDGYESEGLKILAERLSKEHKVIVVAPAGNRSAVSHHITMFSENKLEKINDNTWACSGYPADCSFIGFAGNLLGEKIDVIVSGINYGPNLGTDIIYSGTCAAAREAVLHGIPSVAVSLDPGDWNTIKERGWKFNKLADFVAKNLEVLVSLCKFDYPRAFVNVNAASIDEYKGVKLTGELCVRKYNDSVKVIQKEGNNYITQFVPGNSPGETPAPGTDLEAVRQGYISVSRVYADPINAGVIDGISFSL